MMAPTHQDNRPCDRPSRSADPASPAPSTSSVQPEVDPDRGILLEALFVAALILLGAVSTVWGWFV